MEITRALDTNLGEITYLSEEGALLELIYNAWEEVQLERSENFLIESKEKNKLVITNTSKEGNYLTTDSFVIQSNSNKQNNNMTIGGNGWGLNAAISKLYQTCDEIKISSGENIFEIKLGPKNNTLSEVIFIDHHKQEQIVNGTEIHLNGISKKLIKCALKYYFYSKINNNYVVYNNIHISNCSGTHIFATNNFVFGYDSNLLLSYNFLGDKKVDIRNLIGKKRPRKLAILDYIKDINETILSILNESTDKEIKDYIIKILGPTTLKEYYYELDSPSNFSIISELIALEHPGLILTTKAEKKLLIKYLDDIEINNLVVINEKYEKYYTLITPVNYTKGTTIISKNNRYKMDTEANTQILLDEKLTSTLIKKENEVLNIYSCLLSELGIKKLEYKIQPYENASNGISFEEIVKDDEKKEIKISRSILQDKLYFSKIFLPIAIKFLNINPNLKTEEYIKYLCEEIIERRAKVEECLK